MSDGLIKLYGEFTEFNCMHSPALNTANCVNMEKKISRYGAKRINNIETSAKSNSHYVPNDWVHDRWLLGQGRSQWRGQGGHAPNRRLSDFYGQNWLCWDVGPALTLFCLSEVRSVLFRGSQISQIYGPRCVLRAFFVVNFFEKKCTLAASVAPPPRCKILATRLYWVVLQLNSVNSIDWMRAGDVW